jgi:hypothetical protein
MDMKPSLLLLMEGLDSNIREYKDLREWRTLTISDESCSRPRR